MAALTKTTLASPYTAGDLTMKVTSASAGTGSAGFVKGSIIRVDNEFFKQTADAQGTVIPVRGGEQGTWCQSHNTLSAVFAGSGADFPSPPPGQATPVPVSASVNHATYSAAGAIAVPSTLQNVTVDLVAGSAVAMTLAAPTSAQEGMEMIIMAKDAFAYTVTSTGGFNAGGTGTDVGTFGGAIGDNLHIRAVNLLWNVISKVNVTLA